MTRRRAATRYIALIRAINVRGHQTLRMKDVRETFAAAGCARVRTCIQSGNVIFEWPRSDPAVIRRRIQKQFGERHDASPEIVLRTAHEIEHLVSSDPFKGVAAAGPRVKLYVAFLIRKPRNTPTFPLVSSKEALMAVSIINREVFVVSRLKPNGFFGFPNNFIEEQLGVQATTRNWSTVTRIATFVRSDAVP